MAHLSCEVIWDHVVNWEGIEIGGRMFVEIQLRRGQKVDADSKAIFLRVKR